MAFKQPFKSKPAPFDGSLASDGIHHVVGTAWIETAVHSKEWTDCQSVNLYQSD
jgi:hypothetical protein